MVEVNNSFPTNYPQPCTPIGVRRLDDEQIIPMYEYDHIVHYKGYIFVVILSSNYLKTLKMPVVNLQRIWILISCLGQSDYTVNYKIHCFDHIKLNYIMQSILTWSIACIAKLKVMNSQMGLRPA